MKTICEVNRRETLTTNGSRWINSTESMWRSQLLVLMIWSKKKKSGKIQLSTALAQKVGTWWIGTVGVYIGKERSETMPPMLGTSVSRTIESTPCLWEM